MTQTSASTATTDCIIDTIISFLLPFFLAAAKGNEGVAKAAVRQLMDVYNAGTVAELDLVGRIIGFSVVALDNLRLSAKPDLPEMQMIRYRSSAATLSRTSIQARQMLRTIQAGQETKSEVSRPAVAAAPQSPRPVTAPKPVLPRTTAPTIITPTAIDPTNPPFDIETTQRDARAQVSAFSRRGAGTASLMTNTAILAAAATLETMAAVRHASVK